MGKMIDAEELLKAMDSHDKFGIDSHGYIRRINGNRYGDLDLVPYVHYEDMVKAVKDAPTITKQEIAKPLFDEFKEKLSKWLYHNSESVCGDSMIDIYYLEGHINEILYEMGIIGEAEE